MVNKIYVDSGLLTELTESGEQKSPASTSDSTPSSTTDSETELQFSVSLPRSSSVTCAPPGLSWSKMPKELKGLTLESLFGQVSLTEFLDTGGALLLPGGVKLTSTPQSFVLER